MEMRKNKISNGVTGFSDKKSNFKFGIFGSPVWLMSGAIILIFIFSSYLKVAFQKAAVQRELAILADEKAKLETNNKDLAGLLDYFASESYKEREMRLKLSMQKPGEHVIIISQEGENVSPVNSSAGAGNSSRFANLKKWWNYFFGTK